MPVWDFIVEWQTDADTVKNLSFLTLKAVDGSVINRAGVLSNHSL